MSRRARVGSLPSGIAILAALGALLPATAFAPADLSVTKSDSADPVTEGDPLRYSIEVQNAGPDDATNVVVTDDLPKELELVGVTPSQGGPCAIAGNKVTCSLGTVPSLGNATVIIDVVAAKAKTITNTAAVSSDVSDPQATNNEASAVTTVQKAPKPPKPEKPPKGPTCQTATPTINGTEGSDTLSGTAQADVIFGLGGDDSITGVGGNDVICGGSGNDTVSGQAGADFARGGGGDDRVRGGGENDALGGGFGRDRLGGGLGDDFMNCGPGRDRANGGPGKDIKRSC
jgi:uncharacterized repeat protein (TIGR01451 family)